MSVAIVNQLVINMSQGSNNPLANSRADISQANAPYYIAADDFQLQIWLCNQVGTGPGATLTGAQIDAGEQIVVVGKASNNLGATDALFSATGFSENIEAGTGQYYYQSTLDLTATNLQTALVGSANGRLACTLQVQVQTAANATRLSYLIPVIILQGAYVAGNDMATGNLQYPPPNELVTTTQLGVALTGVVYPNTTQPIAVASGPDGLPSLMDPAGNLLSDGYQIDYPGGSGQVLAGIARGDSYLGLPYGGMVSQWTGEQVMDARGNLYQGGMSLQYWLTSIGFGGGGGIPVYPSTTQPLIDGYGNLYSGGGSVISDAYGNLNMAGTDLNDWLVNTWLAVNGSTGNWGSG